MVLLRFPRALRCSSTAPRPTQLCLELLEARDLLSTQLLALPLPPSLSAHGSVRTVTESGSIDRPEQVVSSRVVAVPLVAPTPGRRLALPPDQSGGPFSNRTTVNMPIQIVITPISLREKPAETPPLNFGLPASENFSPTSTPASVPVETAAISPPRLPTANESASASAAVSNAVGQQATGMSNIVAAVQAANSNGNAVRAVVNMLSTGGLAAAADDHFTRAVADLSWHAATGVVDPATTMLQVSAAALSQNEPVLRLFSRRQESAAPAPAEGSIALTIPATPLFAELVKPANTLDAAAPLLALQQIWPAEDELGVKSVLTRILRSPYLPSAVVALGALVMLCRHIRREVGRQQAAIELPEITGPRGL
jgi:hypothetical protein